MSRQIRLILASTSAYRRQLLERLRIPFECERPETDESPLSGETFVQTALRLSAAKALAVSSLFVRNVYRQIWPNITRKKSPLPEAEEFKKKKNKFEEWFSPKPGKGD